MRASLKSTVARAAAFTLGLGLCAVPCASAEEQPAEEGRLVEVAPGLFAIVEAGGNGNVAFLITDEGVLVVDSGESPAAGRRILSLVARKTDRPVRYLLLTHYHGDHTWGLESFPEAAIVVGHENLLRNMRQITVQDIKGYPDHIETIRKKVEVLKAEGSPDVKKEEERLAANLREYDMLKGLRLVLPEVTFERKIAIHLGGQVVEFLHPGPTHTSGSAVVLFPKQKAVHMGDILFVGSHPYIDGGAGSDTANWVRFLKEVRGWDIETIVPGHGPLAGKEALGEQALYLEDLRREVGASIAKGLSLEEARKAVKMEAYKGRKWTDLLPHNVEAVFREMTRGKNP